MTSANGTCHPGAISEKISNVHSLPEPTPIPGLALIGARLMSPFRAPERVKRRTPCRRRATNYVSTAVADRTVPERSALRLKDGPPRSPGRGATAGRHSTSCATPEPHRDRWRGFLAGVVPPRGLADLGRSGSLPAWRRSVWGAAEPDRDAIVGRIACCLSNCA